MPIVIIFNRFDININIFNYRLIRYRTSVIINSIVNLYVSVIVNYETYLIIKFKTIFQNIRKYCQDYFLTLY